MFSKKEGGLLKSKNSLFVVILLVALIVGSVAIYFHDRNKPECNGSCPAARQINKQIQESKNQ